MPAIHQDNQWRAVDYEKPVNLTLSEPQLQLQQAWAKVTPPLTPQDKHRSTQQLTQLLQQQNAIVLAHYYVEPELQDLALSTGGMVGDSLEMARFGAQHEAPTLLVAGVRFMGETAKILSPTKTILMPAQEASCSLDLGCPAEEFSAFCDQHPDRVVVVYANTSAAVKARADWVVTSSIALEIVAYLHSQGHKIIWGPDRHLGQYIQNCTQADMLLWRGACIVHNEFKGQELASLKQRHPHAKVLVHPESPASVVAQADIVGSTSRLLKAVTEDQSETFIVATDQGILHEMRKHAPEKTFLAAPTAGNGATCKSCAFCPWMAMNNLTTCIDALTYPQQQITVDEFLQTAARRPIQRMLDFAATWQRFKAQTTSLPPDLHQQLQQFNHWLGTQNECATFA